MVGMAEPSRPGRERRFLHGAHVDIGFVLREGEVRLLASVVIDATVLRLWDADVVPTGDSPLKLGVRGIRVILARLGSMAAEEGRTRIVISGFRVGGANPGRDTEWILPCAERRGLLQ